LFSLSYIITGLFNEDSTTGVTSGVAPEFTPSFSKVLSLLFSTVHKYMNIKF